MSKEVFSDIEIVNDGWGMVAHGQPAAIEAVIDMMSELRSATAANGTFNSPHEGLAVIEEEFLELRDEVFWGHKKVSPAEHKRKMRGEAKQLAAMAIRIMMDCTDPDMDGEIL